MLVNFCSFHRTNLPKEVMAFPDYEFKKSLPSFIEHFHVKEYLQDYAEHFGLFSHAKVCTKFFFLFCHKNSYDNFFSISYLRVKQTLSFYLIKECACHKRYCLKYVYSFCLHGINKIMYFNTEDNYN